MRVREGTEEPEEEHVVLVWGAACRDVGSGVPLFFAPSCIYNVNIPLIIKQRECSHAPSMNRAGASFIFRTSRSGGELFFFPPR